MNLKQVFPKEIMELREKALLIPSTFNKYVLGMDRIGRLMTIGIIKGGVNHFLANGKPGGAKTRSVEVFGRLIGGKFHVIQGTPDTMPKDITGSEFHNKKTGDFDIAWTPLVDANLTLVDEGNRMIPSAQSAVLAPMSEGRVSVLAKSTGKTAMRYLHPVNMFLYTQNPLEQEGTNPIPEAQLDRFLFWVNYMRAARDAELWLMKHPHYARREILDEINPVLTLEEIVYLRKWIRANMRCTDVFLEYMLDVIRSTDPDTEEYAMMCRQFPDLKDILGAVKAGVSTRANMALLEACQVRAFLFGVGEDKISPRDFIMPEDLKALASAAFAHRILVKEEAALRKVKEETARKMGVSIMANSVIYPTDGSMKREQVFERLWQAGPNPVTSQHVVDFVLSHIDYSQDLSKYRG